ncbi:amidase [Bordetella hinzii]|uniref:amidase n=1 Tax=Bordetella hinzii TaxID=103855 RepID=UPI0039FDBA43
MQDIPQLLDDYRVGRQRPDSVLGRLFEAIEQSPLNSFIALDREALAAAAPVGRLAGIPIAVKDLIDARGLPTTLGSKQFEQAPPAERDAEVVRRLRAEGALIIGKTNTHEIAYGSTGDKSAFGPVRNPHDPERVAGGSSSGSAAAVAAGLCPAALGTDTSASVRIPAALCGVVGIKPGYDLLPRDGIAKLSPTLDHAGVISRSVADNALLLEVLAQAPGGTYTGKLDRPVAGQRIGMLTGFYASHLVPEVRAAVRAARAAFERAGATVIDIDLAAAQDIYDAQQVILKAEAYHEHEAALRAQAAFDPEIRERLLTGQDIKASEYLCALARRRMAIQAFDEALAQVDVLFSATCGITAPRIGERVTRVGDTDYPTMWLLTRLTVPSSLSGHPSLSVPFSASAGLPIGIQLIGRYHDETTLYQYARLLETSRKPS